MRLSVTRPAAYSLALACLISGATPLLGQTFRYEAETGQLFGTQVRNSVAGYSGSGYVTGFDSGNGSDYVQVQADLPDGLFEMWIGYRSQFGQKGYNFRVDDEWGSGMFNQSTAFSADRAGLFRLQGGVNTLAVHESWGYHDIDYFELRPFTPPAIAPVSSELSDGQAGANARYLMNYLTSIYGHKTLSGQQHEGSKNLSFPVQNYLTKSGGIIPAIRGSDFMEYSPSRIQRGANPRNESEQSIAWAQQNGGIVTMTWHWNAPTDLVDAGDWPWWRGFYTNGTTFDLPAALANPGSSGYQLLLRDIDAISVELQKFEDAGVPVIWRPLHEAQGGWFWWGAHGPDAFKQLWNIMHDRMTNHHGLHNLIWEFTSSAAEGNHLQWYPGDDVVDMIGLDIYTDPSSSMSGQWYDVLEHYNGRKLIALSETGTLPNPEQMEAWDIGWSYFSPWSGTFVDDFSAADLQATLSHEKIITLDELPILPWKDGSQFNGADLDFDGDVDGDDLLQWKNNFGASGGGDANGDGVADGADFLMWQRQSGAIATNAASGLVPEPKTLSLGMSIGLGLAILTVARGRSLT